MLPILTQIEVMVVIKDIKVKEEEVVTIQEEVVVHKEEESPITSLSVRFVKGQVTWQQHVTSGLIMIINL